MESEDAARALLGELRASWAARLALRAQNEAAAVAAVRSQISRGELRLKADIKKSSAFVKKLRVLSEAVAEALLKDARELNLTRYVSECVAALTEAPLKAADLPAALRAISLLHQRYEDFAPALVASLVAAFDALYGAEDKAKAIKRRLLLRLLSDMYLAGVYDDVTVVAHIVQRVARREQQGKSAKAKGNMSINSGSAAGSSSSAQLEVPLLVSFAKAAGMEFLGVRPRKFKDMEKQIGDSEEFQEFLREEPALVPASVQHECLSSFLEAYDVICKFYLAQHATLMKLEARNEKEEVNRGEVTEQHVQELNNAKMLFDKLQTSVNSLADALDRDVPELPLEKKDDESGRGGISLWDGEGSGRAEMQMDGPFDDEDTRSFYEDLPDLLELVPAVVLGLNEQEVAELKKKREAAKNSGSEGNDAEQDDAVEGEADAIAPEDDDMDGEVEDIVNNAEADSSSPVVEDETANAGDVKPESGEEVKDGESSTSAGASASSNPTNYSHQLDAFFTGLEDMVNRDRCDKAAVEFCYKNSRASRNRLVKTLYMVPRTHLELLAYYARLVAILQSVLKDDIGSELVSLLVNEFNGLIKRRNQFRLESKVKNIRFLAELVKFRICPPNVGFGCLKKCFADFQGHNVHVATTFLENCGRFLYCSKHTHVRTDKFLNAMMKLKSAKHLDPQLETLVENAYYMCKPPERVERTAKQYDPLYMFIMKLLYKDLNGTNVNKVIKTLRKLPWQEKSTTGMVLKAALKVTNGKVMHMKWVCDVIKGLSRYHDDVAILLVDDVLEAIRRGLEINDYRDHQRSLGLIKLLGELFNCGLVTTNVIMETLYLLINFSHDISTAPQYTNGQIPETQLIEMKRQWELVPDLRYDPRVFSEVDGPSEVFRIRLVCALIESCTNSGMAASDSKASGSGNSERALSKPRLGRFVVFFQRYILSKPEIPLETDFVIFDLFDALSRTLKDNFKKLETWEDADLAAQLILAKELEEAERRLAKKQTQAAAAAAAAAANGGTTDSLSQTGAESLSQPVDEEEEDLDEEDDSEDDDDDDSDDDEDEDEERENAQAEEDEEDDDDSDDSDEDDDEEEEDEEEKLIIHDRVQKSEEDEAFEKAFKAMMQGSADARKLSGRVSVDKMAIPTVVKNATAPPAPAAMPFGAPDGQSGVVFRMLRRGNKGKVEARHLVVPEGSSLAQHSHRQESEGKKEQNELKRLVLQNMERDDFLASSVDTLAPPAFAAPRPSAPYAAQTSSAARAGYGGGSEWNNDEFGLRRGKGYRGVK